MQKQKWRRSADAPLREKQYDSQTRQILVPVSGPVESLDAEQAGGALPPGKGAPVSPANGIQQLLPELTAKNTKHAK